MPATLELPQLHIAKPCPMQWDDLEGDGPIRRCGQCSLSVYDWEGIDDATRSMLLGRLESGRRVCAGLFQRTDGMIQAADCPVGLRAARARAARTIHMAGAALGVVLAGIAGVVFSRSRTSVRLPAPIASLQPAPPPMIMGEICITPPPPAPTTNATATNDPTSEH
jgi:hypothetical protein